MVIPVTDCYKILTSRSVIPCFPTHLLSKFKQARVFLFYKKPIGNNLILSYTSRKMKAGNGNVEKLVSVEFEMLHNKVRVELEFLGCIKALLQTRYSAGIRPSNEQFLHILRYFQ